MKLLKTIKNKWLRNIGFGLSLTTIAFIFQACYGMPHDRRWDRLVEGRIVDANGIPIEGIKISNDSTIQYARSDSNGYFQMHLPIYQEYKICFEDDRTDNKFLQRDTIIKLDEIKEFTITMDQK